jgi:hypothetical protein
VEYQDYSLLGSFLLHFITLLPPNSFFFANELIVERPERERERGRRERGGERERERDRGGIEKWRKGQGRKRGRDTKGERGKERNKETEGKRKRGDKEKKGGIERGQ